MGADLITDHGDYFTIDVSELAAEVQERLRAECRVFNTLTVDELREWTSLETFEEMQDWMTARIG